MKLIDLLVQELPKRGGWPDGANCITQDVDLKVEPATCHPSVAQCDEDGFWFLDSSRIGGFEADTLSIDHTTSIITRDQYESALSASQKPAWNGEGLPPIGCECEYISNGTSWGKVKVIGLDGEKIVIRPSGEIYYAITPSNKDVFIPFRSEADKKRDAAVEAMQREADEGNNWVYSEYEIIYDAIAAGKIPGVKLDD